jgi:hypothetical protein
VLHSALFVNVRLGCKDFPRTNTLAYLPYSHMVAMQ